MLDFIQLRKQLKINGPIIEVIFYRLPENINEEAEFVRYWRKVVDHVHPVGDISKSFADYTVKNKTIPLRSKTCKLLWERMTIFWNGDVTMCAEDLDGDYVLGNLKEKTIRDIWNGDKMLAIKKLHNDKLFNNINLCSRCDQ
jgi:radical SAM protein with 4Fe4S-binding SPASM domain